ncbi:geranylgeranyl transferase type-2 subunit beta [Nematocida parisii]|nr:geranylgeranyl transferase type-2 subunit beta [Nematocida parisii]KAI5130739.1 geranylgeranyl transferase type-2 subunit beta [Nematocida parisii]
MEQNKKHINFVLRCVREKTRVFYLSEPMRISTFYWVVGSLLLLEDHKNIERLSKKILNFVVECQNEDGGFGARPKYPSCPISTLSALQILYVLKKSNELSEGSETPTSTVLVQEDLPETKRPGQFTVQERRNEEIFQSLEHVSDSSSDSLDIETDTESSGKTTNYVMCNAYLEKIVTNEKLIGFNSILNISYICYYIASKSLLTELSLGGPDMFVILAPMKKILCEYISQCVNLDGGIGAMPGSESHAAYTFSGVSSLFSLGEIGLISIQETATLIGLLQTNSGGISGRVDKIEEICSTFWGYSTLAIMGVPGYVDSSALRNFISSCECVEGGYSDRPNGTPTLLYTFYALSCLAVLDNKSVMDILPSLSLCLFD